MGQLPLGWNPSSEAPRPSQSREAEVDAGVMSVTELSACIIGALETLPTSFRVVGEMSNLKRSRNGHWYFSLKDETALIDCAMWSSRARGVQFEPTEGDAVEARGHVEHYAKQGRTQLIVERLKPAGRGALQERYEALCAKLREAGWFDADLKQELPQLPRRIAVLTAAGSAAFADVRRTSADRCPSVGLDLVDVPVQGDGAAGRIAAMIAKVDAAAGQLGIDAILLTRGGGSLEDLWAFNEEAVAEAIHRCATPVVAAIGHESDTSIAELVADHRASTPTQAIMALLPDASELVAQLDERSHRLHLLLRRHVEGLVQWLQGKLDRVQSQSALLVSQWRRQLEAWTRLLAERRPDRQLATRRESITRLSLGLRRAFEQRIEAGDRRLSSAAGELPRSITEDLRRRRASLLQKGSTLEAIGPRAVLERGYSITMDEHGHAMRDARDLDPGAILQSRLASGQVTSRVEAVQPGDEDTSGTVDER